MGALGELQFRLNNLREVDRTQPNWVRDFEAALSEVNELSDRESIVPLMLLMDDATEYDEAMYSIVHSVETYPIDEYLNSFVLALPRLCRDTPRWASIILMRILNSQPATQELKSVLPTCKDVEKSSLTWLLDRIEEVSEGFVPSTTPLRSALVESA